MSVVQSSIQVQHGSLDEFQASWITTYRTDDVYPHLEHEPELERELSWTHADDIPSGCVIVALRVTGQPGLWQLSEKVLVVSPYDRPKKHRTYKVLARCSLRLMLFGPDVEAGVLKTQ